MRFCLFVCGWIQLQHGAKTKTHKKTQKQKHRMNLILCLVICLCLVQFSLSAYCSGSPQPGERVSNYDIYDQPLKFVRSVKNAKLFTAGPAGAEFPVVHVWGSPYEVGYAQGTIQRKAIIEFVTKTWAYLSNMVVDAFPFNVLPVEIQQLIVQKGINGALDWTRSVTAPFTSQAYLDEMQGLADATGLSYDLVYRLNMFPELTKASCSFFGAWGESVRKSGHAYQLRALDYDVDGPFKDYPQVIVYHPTEGSAYSQVGWPGSIGVLTGFSSNQIAISEIGAYFADASFGQGVEGTPPQKVKGEPWMFVLRDVLQFSSTMEAAQQRITDSNRTCNLIIGLGDGKLGKSYGCEYSGYVAVFYDDTNQLPVNETWHPVIKDTVYNGMDWLCPGYNQVLGQQLSKYHGEIDEDIIIKNILPTVQTGNLHIAVYDLTDSLMHVSFAKGTIDKEEEEEEGEEEPLFAYQRQFTRLHMKDIFEEKPPLI